MAILDGVSDGTDYYEPILGSSEEELRRRAARGPLRSGSILGAKNSISPLMNSGASLDERPALGDRPILGSSGTPRPKMITLNGDGSPYARMTEASSPRGIAEQARNAPILGNRDDQPTESILGGSTESRPRFRDTTVTPGLDRAKAELAAQPAPILGNPPGVETSRGILGVKPPQPARPTPAADAYESLRAQGSPWQRESKLGKVADVLGMVTGVGRTIERGTGLGSLGYRAKLGEAQTAAEEESRLAKAADEAKYDLARTSEQEAKAEQERARAEALRNPRPRADRTIPPETDDYYSLLDQVNPATGKNYTSQEALEQVKGAGKQDRQFTNAFEAFAYGTPEQKQSAKDFIDYEKKVGARYRTPNEFDLRYKLFREDPETYRAMFGDKGEVADERARAANRSAAMSVLRYTQRQRDEISKDYMLGEDERAQKLRDLDEFERPFKETVAGGSGDRVKVIAPDGTPGTIPRKQLDKALNNPDPKKRYRVAQ